MSSHEKILDEILAISPNNDFLKYIVERIQRDDYRGMHRSQHNRYDLDVLVQVLESINEIVGTNEFVLHPGDYKKVKYPECEDYYKIVDRVNEKIRRGTINSVKKNFFVDFARMEFLKRYNKEGNEIESGKAGIPVRSVKLSNFGIKLLNASFAAQCKIFTDGLDNLFEYEITRLVETLYYSDFSNDKISAEEFMLIFSDIRPEIKDKKIELLKAFRDLSRSDREKAIRLIKEYCNPKKFKSKDSNKTEERDFHNWKNECQQIFLLLNFTVYFIASKEYISLNIGNTGIFSQTQINQRSSTPKVEYFDLHKIQKQKNFHLHHIVPISKARNKQEFKLIDNWQNLIYLEDSKHQEIPVRNNNYIILSVLPSVIHFDDFENNRISAENNSTAFYDVSHSDTMEKYNKKLLKEIYEYKV